MYCLKKLPAHVSLVQELQTRELGLLLAMTESDNFIGDFIEIIMGPEDGSNILRLMSDERGPPMPMRMTLSDHVNHVCNDSATFLIVFYCFVLIPVLMLVVSLLGLN